MKKDYKIKKAQKVNYILIREINKDGSLNSNNMLIQVRLTDGKTKPYKSKQKYK